MNVFVAGATGAIGQRLVPMLVAGGHTVTGMTRSPRKAERLREAGAQAAVADALDPEAVMAAVLRAEPEVVVHELTGLSGMRSLRNPDRAFELTNRLRSEGTDHLLAAAHAVGARRFVAQSFAGWPYARTGAWVKTEEESLDPSPPRTLRKTLAAIEHLETAVTGATWLEGVVLRYGGFYGPGTSLEPGGSTLEDVRRRRYPVVGPGTGVWSFIHIDDAAEATTAAIEHGPPGIYNVVDDDPAPVSAWLPALARAADAKPPRHLPTWVARLVAGEAVAAMMTESRGAANAKARQNLAWRPAHPTWRQGFDEVLGAAGDSSRGVRGSRSGNQ